MKRYWILGVFILFLGICGIAREFTSTYHLEWEENGKTIHKKINGWQMSEHKGQLYYFENGKKYYVTHNMRVVQTWE